MDFCRNIAVSGGLPSEYQPEQLLSPSSSKLGSLDDLFSTHNTEGDVSLEWLSIFVEDCFSSSGNCVPAPVTVPGSELQKTTSIINTRAATNPTPPPLQQSSDKVPILKQQNTSSSPLHEFVIPGKARSKRKRRSGPVVLLTKSKSKSKTQVITSWSHHLIDNPFDQNNFHSSSDPPLLQQTYWLADSELIILPKKEDTSNSNSSGRSRQRSEKETEMRGDEGVVVVGKEKEEEEEEEEEEKVVGNINGRRCRHCQAQRTPQWRAGPMGPKTLCNACGVRYKSGRLLPEYRPAKSPTFVSYKHSNSHKKVMEMRMSLLSSIPN